MNNLSKDPITTADMDLAIEGDDKKVVAESTRLMNLAKQAGIFKRLDDPGVNGWPTLYLKGPKSVLLTWIGKNYDSNEPEVYLAGAN